MAVRRFCIFILALLVSLSQSQECKEGWVAYGEVCYGYGDTPVSWAEAAVICSLQGARLVEIESGEENEFIKDIASNISDSRVWIGGTDIFEEGNWVWVSTRSHIYPFHDWHSNQPSDSNSAGEDCAALSKSYQYQWEDDSCTKSYNFICETIASEEQVIG